MLKLADDGTQDGHYLGIRTSTPISWHSDRALCMAVQHGRIMTEEVFALYLR
jgi:hypothetical protein